MHEWIENYHEYEAVLQCKNALQTFEGSVVLRAFQTFGWNDASTPGNDNSFVHEESGTIVRYEGALLAIDCGHDRLNDALSDLISVLHGLGWVSIEVYHAPETMKALMTDIGKAIPANMQNFDVVPAIVDKPLSDFPESAALIEKGRAIMQMGSVDAANETMLEELQSMDSQISQRPASKEKQAIILVDDEQGNSDSDSLSVSLAVAPTANTREVLLAPSVTDDFSSEEPAVFNLPVAETIVSQPAPLGASSANLVQTEIHVAPVMPVASTVSVLSRPANVDRSAQLMDEPDHVGGVVRSSDDSRRTMDAPAAQMSEEHLVETAVVAAIDVGNSTIVFDSPAHPISQGTIEAMFIGDSRKIDVEYKNIVYVRPGSVGEQWRWDLLGELSPEKPWFAEKLAGALGLDGLAATLISLIVTEARTANDGAQLRNVLTGLINGEDYASALGTASHPARQLERWCDVEAAMAQIVGALAPLLLCPSGLAFVDCDHRERGSAATETLTIRSLLTSSDALLIIVQVDALDGQFAHRLAELMRVVADSYGSSKIYKVVAQLAADQREVESERLNVESARAELGAQVTAITGEYFDRLRNIGCDVPRLSGSHAA